MIDEAEAAVVRRLFALFLEGAGLREIAHRLNEEGVPTPRARAHRGHRASWAPTAIREMLRNPLYRGERLFNRTEWVKDHATGRRRRYERPEAEWVREDRRDLAIVTAESFDAVQAEVRRRGARYLRGEGGREIAGTIAGLGHPGPRRNVLSGLLACGACGGAFHGQSSSERYGCGWHRGRGPVACDNALRVPRLELEERVFGAIRERVLVPEVVAEAVEQAMALVAEGLRGNAQGPSREERRRLEEIDEELRALRRMAERGK